MRYNFSISLTQPALSPFFHSKIGAVCFFSPLFHVIHSRSETRYADVNTSFPRFVKNGRAVPMDPHVLDPVFRSSRVCLGAHGYLYGLDVLRSERFAWAVTVVSFSRAKRRWTTVWLAVRFARDGARTYARETDEYC